MNQFILKENIETNNLLWKVPAIILSLSAIVYISLSLFRGYINVDSYFYIGASRFILEGKVPFLDFPPGYTPLSFYLMCIPLSIFGVSFQVGLVIIYLLDVINAFLVYFLCRQYTDNKWTAVFFAAFSLVLCLNCDGGGYLLEPYALFFGLLSLTLLKEENTGRLILSGFLCSCSFWCKQYGLGFIFLALLQVFLSNSFGKELIKKLGLLLLGFCGGMVIFVSLLLVQGVEPAQLLSLSGSDYEKEGIPGFIASWKKVLIAIPLLIVPIVLTIVNLPKAKEHKLLTVAFCGVFGFMLQCYIRAYPHYRILVMPFCALLLFAGIEVIQSSKMKRLYMLLLCFAPLIPCCYMAKHDLSLIKSQERLAQIQDARSIESIIPQWAENVFTTPDLHPVMLLNTYNPPLIEKYGLSNGFVSEPQEVKEMVSAASYCIISKRYMDSGQFTEETQSYLSEKFDKTEFLSKGFPANYSVYVRRD